MGTKQPSWKFIANLGDASPLDYGGYFVYRDDTGVYSEEAEHLVLDEDGRYTIFRFILEQLKMVDNFWLIPVKYESSWAHPAQAYDKWFHKDLESVASSMGTTKNELEVAFTSPNPLVRAEAYRMVGDYLGWENLDHEPLTGLTRSEVEKRYRDELKTIRR